LLCTLNEKYQTKSYDLETARDREAPGTSFDGGATAQRAKETMQSTGVAMGKRPPRTRRHMQGTAAAAQTDKDQDDHIMNKLFNQENINLKEN
jgi:hypothetical protein